jgi:hypothetical protein
MTSDKKNPAIIGPLPTDVLRGKDLKDYKIIPAFSEKGALISDKKDAAKTALPKENEEVATSSFQRTIRN